jgi:hypothetical protein
MHDCKANVDEMKQLLFIDVTKRQGNSSARRKYNKEAIVVEKMSFLNYIDVTRILPRSDNAGFSFIVVEELAPWLV